MPDLNATTYQEQLQPVANAVTCDRGRYDLISCYIVIGFHDVGNVSVDKCLVELQCVYESSLGWIDARVTFYLINFYGEIFFYQYFFILYEIKCSWGIMYYIQYFRNERINFILKIPNFNMFPKHGCMHGWKFAICQTAVFIYK